MAAKRLAFMDVGTNTLLLLVVEADESGAFVVLDDRAAITRLGQGVDRTRLLGAAGQERSLQTIREYLARCGELGVEEVAAVGTSAFRDAGNSDEFQSRLRRELGLTLRILSGAEEAFYSFLAVKEGLGAGVADFLVVDVGGGSTEVIQAAGGELARWASLDIGSVRLTERILRSDPAREDEYAEAVAAIDREIERLGARWGNAARPERMFGIAGTFTTLAAVERGLREYSHGEVHGARLSRLEVARQVRLYKSLSVAERKKIPGLEPQRADVILAGAALVERLMALFSVEESVVSDQGIRYGLLFERLSRSRPFH
jgi:exopolyphosphatase/guanosine-5'-triphosphate,3'-diphosphate pyrophosphatase